MWLWSPATEGRAFPENTDTSACRFAVTDRPPPAPAPICPLWQGCLSACHPLVPDWTSQVVRQWTIPESVPAHPIGTWRQGSSCHFYLSYCNGGKAVASIRNGGGGISAVVCRAVRHHPSYTCLSVTYIIYKGNNCNFNVKVRALWHPSN